MKPSHLSLRILAAGPGLGFALLFACTQPPSSEEALERAEAAINADSMLADVAALADDAMRGRAPGTPGDQMARAYLARRLGEMGIEPAGDDGGWEQSFDIVAVTAAPPPEWTFEAGAKRLALADHADFIASSGVQSEAAEIAGAEPVFVGYGIAAPEYQWDDWKGTDVTGKVLVMLNNDPDWNDALFAGNRRLYYGRWTYKYEVAAQRGAVAAIIIHTTPSAGYGWNVVQTSWSGEQVELPAEGEPRTQVKGWVTEDAARRLFELGGHDLAKLVESARSRDFRPVALGITTSLRLANTVSRNTSANVLGRIPGSDLAASAEHVVYSAHFDHLGDGGEDPADPIYNGALDNASGVGQVLAIAGALAKSPTRRSILFAFVTAEESGLLGSAYYARHPTIPPGRMVANINLDGGNIWGRTRDVSSIGLGSSSLDSVVEAGAARQGRRVEPDAFPDRGFFYRSDQFNFAKIGVPAIYLDTGTGFVDRPEGWGREQIEAWEATHYHQVSDEVTDEWNWDGMVDDARLALYCGVIVGNAPTIPTWNPGNEFEATRQRALAELK